MATEHFIIACPPTSPMFAEGPPRATHGMLHRELLRVCYLLLNRELRSEIYSRFVAESYPRSARCTAYC